MSFTFGVSKASTGFPFTTSASTITASGGAGDAAKTTQAKPLFGITTPSLFAVPASSAPSFSFGSATPAITTTVTSIGPLTTSATVQPQGSSLNLATAAPVPGFSLGAVSASSTANITTAISSAASAGTATAPNTTILTTTTTTSTSIPSSQPTLSFGFSTTPTSTSLATAAIPSSIAITSSTESALPASGILTYNQLEDAINKWTIDLEEQEKLFTNQAKQLNAWDCLLISNGEKVLQLNSNIEKVKQQQEQLDQELDFVLAQQNELESCIIPLEKELQDVPVQDIDRNETYQLAESLDSQLKQMSEDLKEVIEHLNESAKCQEMSDPISQISRILSVHMDSLQWIDRNTAQISEQLDQITKMQEYTKHII
ncbi:nuclear pore glycoprotein p62-like isoform X2 [Agrilus planipennis]|uniref:Nuclear pore glycoprotein p62 isoform X2 n=1 Tax=Agrilus planipennis TaxID=224129 RepID=A0A1W4WTE0_AGRPL|nr:nuclear pore glycoprotein p62 isoform X2 [Agrilus planipennis]XP_025832143.1 nuclear pore glycoprotein p62-like isoform X2 [Agrilus planipennis]